MGNGTIPNSAGVKKLTIGVTGRDGKRAALQFQAESTAAPLVAVEPDAANPDIETPQRKRDWTRAAETKAVKDALNAAGINAVVKHGTGTAWGWLEINVGSAEQFTHERTTYCDCDQCRDANRRICDIANRAARIAQQVTGRHGEYNGNVLCLSQKAWNKKQKRSVEILQPTRADLAEMSAHFASERPLFDETPLGDEMFGGE